jgi:hypothetical protein
MPVCWNKYQRVPYFDINSDMDAYWASYSGVMIRREVSRLYFSFQPD